MRVAWVTHRPLFQNFIGGAEMADETMIRRRPEGVEVTLVAPGGVAKDLSDFDHVVVSGLGGFTRGELDLVGSCRPSVWVHDSDTTNHPLHHRAGHFICLTPEHLARETEKMLVPNSRCHVNPGWMDTSQLYPVSKNPSALWAHRNVPHKGLDLARAWAEKNKIELHVLFDAPQEQVWEWMRSSSYFVLLSYIFDAGPRAVIEAQLCGCQIVYDNVGGFFDEDEHQLRERVNRADKDFWEVVLS